MRATHFDQFNDDTTILAIGSLFKKDKTTSWGINLDLGFREQWNQKPT